MITTSKNQIHWAVFLIFVLVFIGIMSMSFNSFAKQQEKLMQEIEIRKELIEKN